MGKAFDREKDPQRSCTLSPSPTSCSYKGPSLSKIPDRHNLLQEDVTWHLLLLAFSHCPFLPPPPPTQGSFGGQASEYKRKETSRYISSASFRTTLEPALTLGKENECCLILSQDNPHACGGGGGSGSARRASVLAADLKVSFTTFS